LEDYKSSAEISEHFVLKKEPHSQAFRYDLFSIKEFLNKTQTHGFVPSPIQ